MESKHILVFTSVANSNHTVYQTRERTFEDQIDLVPSTTYIIAVRIYPTLPL